jgi:hypothetical protein
MQCKEDWDEYFKYLDPDELAGTHLIADIDTRRQARQTPIEEVARIELTRPFNERLVVTDRAQIEQLMRALRRAWEAPVDILLSHDARDHLKVFVRTPGGEAEAMRCVFLADEDRVGEEFLEALYAVGFLKRGEGEPHPSRIERSWLVRRLERPFSVRKRSGREIPVGQRAWDALEAERRPGDEIWYYRHAPGPGPVGSERGYALVRDGEPVRAFAYRKYPSAPLD